MKQTELNKAYDPTVCYACGSINKDHCYANEGKVRHPLVPKVNLVCTKKQ